MNIGDKMNSVKYNAVINAILSVANIIFPLITFPYVSRVLLVENNGRISFASALLNFFSLFATLGLSTYGIKACARVREDRIKLSKTVHELLLLNVITTIFVTIALIVATFIVPGFQQEWLLLFIYSWNMILNVVGMNWLYSAVEQYDYITKRSILFKFLGVILMFLFVHKPDDLYIYAIITVFANVGGNIVNIIYSRKFVEFKWFGDYNCKQHLKPTLAMFSTYLAVNVYSSLDSVMLGFIQNEYQVGIYATAVKIKSVLTTLITSLGTVLLPRMSYYIAQGKWDDFSRLLRKSYCAIIMIAIPMMLYFILVAEPSVLFLSGEAYLDAVTPLKILMPILVITSLSNITGMQILIPTGGEWKFAISVSCGAVVNLILNFILIPQYGAVGAAYGTLFAEITQFVAQLIFSRKYLRGAISVKATVQVLVATVGAAVAFFVINTVINFGALLTLILTATAYFGVYAVILLWERYEMFMEMCNMVLKPITSIIKYIND